MSTRSAFGNRAAPDCLPHRAQASAAREPCRTLGSSRGDLAESPDASGTCKSRRQALPCLRARAGDWPVRAAEDGECPGVSLSSCFMIGSWSAASASAAVRHRALLTIWGRAQWSHGCHRATLPAALARTLLLSGRVCLRYSVGATRPQQAGLPCPILITMTISCSAVAKPANTLLGRWRRKVDASQSSSGN